MEQRRLGRVEVFWLEVGLQGPPAEGDDLAAQVGDGDDQAATEAVVGRGDVLARDQQPGGDHVGQSKAARRQMFLEGRPPVWRKAHAEALAQFRRDIALGEVFPAFAPARPRQHGLEEPRRLLVGGDQIVPRILLTRGLG